MLQVLSSIYDLIAGFVDSVLSIGTLLMSLIEYVAALISHSVEAIGAVIGTLLSFLEFWELLISAPGQVAILPPLLAGLVTLVMTCIVLKLVLDVFT